MAFQGVSSQDIIDTVGPLFVGICLNWFFFGILLVQIYSYVHRCQHDGIFLKGLVLFVFMCDLAQTGGTCDFAWKLMVSGWGEPSVFVSNPKSSLVLVIVNPIVAATVQIFFAWRIWRLVNKKYKYLYILPVLIVLVALMQAIAPFLIAATSVSHENQQMIIIAPSVRIEGIIWLSSSFTADAMIALTMLYILQTARKQANSPKAESIVSKLILNSVNTGLVTAIVACVELATLVRFPEKNFHIAPAFILGKLYSNVLLANLNTRRNIQSRAGWSDDSDLNTGIQPLEFRRNPLATETDGDIESGSRRHLRTESYELQKYVWDSDLDDT